MITKQGDDTSIYIRSTEELSSSFMQDCNKEFVEYSNKVAHKQPLMNSYFFTKYVAPAIVIAASFVPYVFRPDTHVECLFDSSISISYAGVTRINNMNLIRSAKGFSLEHSISAISANLEGAKKDCLIQDPYYTAHLLWVSTIAEPKLKKIFNAGVKWFQSRPCRLRVRIIGLTTSGNFLKAVCAAYNEDLAVVSMPIDLQMFHCLTCFGLVLVDYTFDNNLFTDNTLIAQRKWKNINSDAFATYFQRHGAIFICSGVWTHQYNM